MTVREAIAQLSRLAPDAPVTVQLEDQSSSAEQIVWDGEAVVVWDGDHLYPVEHA